MAPNAGRIASTTDVLAQWDYKGANFAVDPMKQVTYRSQSAHIFKVEGKDKAFVYVGDNWNSTDVGNSLQVWLPISVRSGYPTVRWHDSWDVSIFDDMYRYKRAAEMKEGNIYSLLEKQSNRLVSKPANKGFTLEDDDDALNMSLAFIPTATANVYKIKDSKSGKCVESMFGTLRLNPAKEGDAQLWAFELLPDGYYKIKNVKDGKYLSVSGAGTFAGTGLYLAELSKTVPQEFAVYFDSRKYNYGEADIFSKAYAEHNRQLIKSNQ